jgi:hypothetical protein
VHIFIPRRTSSDNLGREKLIESNVTDPHFIAVRRDEIAQNGKSPQTRKNRSKASIASAAANLTLQHS